MNEIENKKQFKKSIEKSQFFEKINNADNL